MHRPCNRCAQARTSPGSGSARCLRSAVRSDSWGWSFQRQNRAERAALPERALDVDRATEQCGEAPTDRKAEPRALMLALQAGIDLPERLEQGQKIFSSHANPRVGYAQAHRARGFARAIRVEVVDQLDAERHSATLGELDGVVQQVQKDLLDSALVARH